ncbi:MAG: ATP-binding protein [Candidatus Cloacimonadaceae bacterium]|nr:ATP-binding protein [Candidatus Cloacimonadaceae bacterium]
MTNDTRPKSVGMFNGLDESVVADLIKDLQRVKIPKGESIIAEHTHGDNLYLILRGKVEINKDLRSPETPFAQLSILAPGDFFGEMAVVDDEPRSASVIAHEDVELLIIPRAEFSKIAFSQPLVLYNLIRTMTSRLRDTNTRFTEVAEQLISKNRLMAIGMAASKIIHDIKTPLTVIVLTAQLIESVFPGSSEFTESIIKQTKLVDQMVREILDFARGHEVEPMIQQVDLDAFLKDIMETYGHALQGREITMTMVNNVVDPVFFDESKIRRVIMNLIKNSSEAIPDEGSINISTRLQAGWLQISIIDNGPGIPQKIRDNLFKPFVSADKPHGTGLGLAICKKLVHEHHGRLEFVPTETGGCRFDIRIPQHQK